MPGACAGGAVLARAWNTGRRGAFAVSADAPPAMKIA